jgi:hypothetical protein
LCEDGFSKRVTTTLTAHNNFALENEMFQFGNIEQNASAKEDPGSF